MPGQRTRPHLGHPQASAFASGSPPPQRVAVSGVEVVSGPGAGELSVTWDVHDAGPVDYRVSWRPAGERFRRAGDVEWNAFPSGAEHVISGLVPGGVYEVRVRARFGVSGSRWSDVVSGAAAAHPPPAQDLPVPQSISAPVPEEPLDYARAHDNPELRLEDAEHLEGGFFGLHFGVELSAVSSHNVSVTYSTSIESGDTAEAEDFVAATGTVTVFAGDDYAAFVVDLNNDGVYEGDETFTVTFSNAVNANLLTPATVTISDPSPYGSILDGVAKGTIVNDDEELPEGADYVGQTVDAAGSVAVGESWYHGRSAVNGRIEYRINARRDVDWYQVALPRGSCYEIDVRGATTWQRYLDGDFPAQYAPTEPLTLAHPFIQGLYDADGDYVEGTQDKGYLAYPESTVTLRPRQGGTYYIAVTNRIPFESGTFDLSVIDLGSATLTCTYID